jgi:H+/Na+-translocating ferredoxin:NAD+ oxidoreductase subunit B
VVHTNYDAEVVEDNCIACEACADRCQMDAITVDDVTRINNERRIGSDLCVPECPNEASGMRRKTADAQYVPPANGVETYLNMPKERGLM